jgi:hypothetical protein
MSCGLLIGDIQRLCDEKFGHNETRNIYHQKKCINIRFDRNASTKEIKRTITLLQQRAIEFNECGKARELYTIHKPPCPKSHLDPKDQKHTDEYKSMYNQQDKCIRQLQEFHTISKTELDKYKRNPNPRRHDILYKEYIIYLYDEQQRLEEEIRLSILKEKEQQRKSKELAEIAERNKRELEEFQKQQAKERSKERSQQRSQEIEESKEEASQAEQHAKQHQRNLIEQRDREKQNTKFIERTIRDIKITESVFNNKHINKYIKQDYIQHFIKKSLQTIEDPLIYKMICYMFFHQLSEEQVKKIERHFTRIYAGLI